MKLLKYFLLLYVFPITVSCTPRTYTINFIKEDSTSLSEAHLKESFSFAQNQFSYLDINLEYGGLISIPKIINGTRIYSTIDYTVWGYSHLYKLRKLNRLKRGLYILMLPSYETQFEYLIGGLANYCQLSGFDSNAVVVNDFKETYLSKYVSSLVITHEIGHLLGISHSNGVHKPSIMKPLLFADYNYYKSTNLMPTFLRSAKHQVKRCITKGKRNVRR